MSKKTSRQRDWETYGLKREGNMLFRHLHTIKRILFLAWAARNVISAKRKESLTLKIEKMKMFFLKRRNNMCPSLFHPYVSQSRWRLVFFTPENIQVAMLLCNIELIF